MVAGQTISRDIIEIATRWKFEGETRENAKISYNFFGLTLKHYFRNFQRNTERDVIYTISTKFFLEISFERIDTDKDFLSRF